MEHDRDHSKKPTISTHLERLLSTRYQLSRKLLSGLKASDRQELIQIALGGIYSDYRIRALKVIALIGGVEETKILSKILADSEEKDILRAATAVNLSLLPARYAEPELIANLGVRDDLVRIKVIKSLGQIGGKKALQELDRISDVKPDYVRKQLAFAKALISHRLGLDREDLPFIEGAKRKSGLKDELIGLSAKQIGPDEVRNCLQLFQGNFYGIDISENRGFEISVGRIKWVVLLNKELVEGYIFSSITKQKALAGLLALWTKETGTYAVQYAVLTDPHDLSIDIMVVRTDGEVCYSGRGSVKDGIMTFSISDIERPGTAPTHVTGRLRSEGIEFQVRIPFAKRIGKRCPTKLSRLG